MKHGSKLQKQNSRRRNTTINKSSWKTLLDISEYDKIKVIKIHESNRMIVVLAKSHTSPGDVAETVLGYLYESDEEEEQQQQEPPCLF